MKQPDSSHLGDCQLCLFPLPLDKKKQQYHNCCSQIICLGCSYALIISVAEIVNATNRNELAKAVSCPFCRTPQARDDEENVKYLTKRIKAGCPVAMAKMGSKCYDEGDYDGAVEFWKKAAKLGDSDAHYRLAFMYREGKGVEKNEKKELYHLEQASIGGHPTARHTLGVIERTNGRIDRAVRHMVIAANLGCVDSMRELWAHYHHGHIRKENLEAAIRKHNSAIEATKSTQREAVEAALRNYGSNSTK